MPLRLGTWYLPDTHLRSYTVLKTKETVRALLERLPDNCTVEDVLYQLYVLQEVERGRADVAAGRTIPHSRVADELRRKWLLGAAK